MDALILIDFENEWLDSHSDYYVGEISEMLDRTRNLLDYCRKRNYKIIFTRHVQEEGQIAFVKNSKQTEIIDALSVHPQDIVLTKYHISSFYQTNMDELLDGVDRVVVCGILTNLCVRSFVSDAYDRDFDITLIEDCCLAFDEQTHEFTLSDLKKTREEIVITNCEQFIKR